MKKKEWVFSTFFAVVPLCLIGSTLAISPISVDNSLSTTNSDKKVFGNNLTDHQKINKIYNDAYSEPISTNDGFLGMSVDKKVIVFTSYGGIEMWKFDLTSNTDFAGIYKHQYPTEDVNNATIKSLKMITVNSKNIIVLLVSNANYEKGLVFGLDASIGTIFDPINTVAINKDYSLLSYKTLDGANLLFENSSGNILVTSDGKWLDSSVIVDNSNTSKQKKGYFNTTSLVILDNKGVTGFNNVNNKGIGLKYTSPSVNNGNVTDSTIDENTNYLLYAIIPGKKNSGINLAIMYFPRKLSSSWQLLTHLILVDDSMNPIMQTNDSGDLDFVEISKDNNTPLVYNITSTTEFTSIDMIPHYGYQVNSNDDKSRFLVVYSGKENYAVQYAVSKDSNGKYAIVGEKGGDMQNGNNDHDVLYFSYNKTTNRLYTSNKWSNNSTKALIGYVDFNQNVSQPTSLLNYNAVITSANGGNQTYVPSIVSVVSESALTNYPLVYADPNPSNNDASDTYFNTLFGYYDNVGQPFRLNQLTYKDQQTEFQKQSYYKTKLPSTITENELISLLDITGQSNNNLPSVPSNSQSYLNKEVSINADDVNGVLDATYNVTYPNFYNPSTSSTIKINSILTMGDANKTDGKYLYLVTNGNGTEENNQKYKEIAELKAKNLPSQITKQNIIDKFLMSNVYDKQGNKITITSDEITLIQNDSLGELEVSVDVSNKTIEGYNKHQLDMTSNKYTGFRKIEGYNYRVRSQEEIASSYKSVFGKELSSLYPSEINNIDVINYFVELGSSFSRDIEKWNVAFTPNNLDGELTISLTSTDNTIPSSIDKKIMQDVKFLGFKKATDEFKNPITLAKSTSSNIADEFKKYETAYNEFIKYTSSDDNYSNARLELLTTGLMKSVSSTSLFAKTDWKISLIGEATSYAAKLKFELKDNAKAIINVGTGNTDFVLTESDKQQLINNVEITYPIELNWETVLSDQSFVWLKPNFSDSKEEENFNPNSDVLSIDLSKASLNSINSDMYANQVTSEKILNLFSLSYFDVKDFSLMIDNPRGIINATMVIVSNPNSSNSKKQINFKSNVNVGVNPGDQILKKIIITGFKKPINPIYFVIPSVAVSVVIILIVVLVVYFKVIKRNLRKTLTNTHTKNKRVDFNSMKNNSKEGKKPWRK